MKNYKKIVILSPSVPPIDTGGIVTTSFALAKLYKKHGHEVHVVTYNNPNFSAKISTTDEGIIIHRNYCPSIIRKSIYKLSSIIFRIIDGKKDAYQLADVVISQIGMIGALNSINRISPSIIISADQGTPLLFLSRKSIEKIVLVSHHNPKRFIRGIYSTINSRSDVELASNIERISLNKVDMVVAPSRYMHRAFTSVYNQYKRKVIVIPNLIDIDYITSIKSIKFPTKKNSKVIYIPSGFSHYKGGENLVRIIRALAKEYKNNITLYISGEIDSYLLKQLKQIKQVYLFTPGRVSYQINIGYIKSCNLCLSPTMIESYGMSILEAMLCGLPVVHWNAGGNADFPISNSSLIRKQDYDSTIRELVKYLEGTRTSHDTSIMKLTIQYIRNAEKKYLNLIN